MGCDVNLSYKNIFNKNIFLNKSLIDIIFNPHKRTHYRKKRIFILKSTFIQSVKVLNSKIFLTILYTRRISQIFKGKTSLFAKKFINTNAQ